jgi:hypothetical protein
MPSERMSRLAALKSARRAVHVIPWPGGDPARDQVGVRVLTVAEVQDAYWAAAAEVRRRNGGELARGRALRGEEEIQLLWRALVDPDDASATPALYATSADELRRHVTADERAMLAAAYLDWQREAAPVELSAEEFEALLEALKKAPRADLLTGCSSSMLRRLVLGLAERCSS